MKILHICLSGPYTEGWLYQDNLLSKFQKNEETEVSLITSKYMWNEKGSIVRSDEKEYVNRDGVHIIRLKNKWGTTIKSTFKIYCGLYKCIQFENPDIIFVHGMQLFQIFCIIKYVKKHRKTTLFFDNHADFYNSAKSWMSKKVLHGVIWRTIARKTIPFTKKYYGVTPARVDFLMQMYRLPKEKVSFLPMGVDDDLVKEYLSSEIRENRRCEYGFSANDFVILSGGKTDRNKRQVVLLMRAVNQLADQSIKLIVFGSVSEDIKPEFDRELTERVQYVGWKKPNEIFAEFAVADIVAFPGLHSVLWEQAVGVGKPCVFRKINGFQHIDLGGNCLFFKEDTVDSYVETILLAKKNIIHLKLAAETKGKDCFSYRNIALKVLEDNNVSL